jgi:hypothetical protein
MKLALCTLVLNEMEWLPKLYEQHKNWPGVEKWVFVESADRIYAETNPDMVSPEGLSVDGTTEFLSELALADSRVTHIKHGFCSAKDKAQGKCEARDQYLRAITDMDFHPNYFIVLDADEFYPFECQTDINYLLPKTLGNGFAFRHREIWYPQYLQDRQAPMFDFEVSGGFWDIPYCRVWRWYRGLHYGNHNTPFIGKTSLDLRLNRMTQDGLPYMVHMGFASQLKTRAAKNRYYEARGEAVDRKRSWYCESRQCFETWEPKMDLPRGAKVSFYTGLIPECFDATASYNSGILEDTNMGSSRQWIGITPDHLQN